MPILKKLLLFFILLQTQQVLQAQTDSCTTRISLLTCSPGDELYATFGHSALRVSNAATGTDIVFNYGTFDFNDPDFYTKFIRGKLLYYLNTEDFNSFMYSYQMEQRSVQEQVLQLTCEQKQKIISALQNNLKEENRYYKYDFTYDNCTTRLRDLIEKNSGDGFTTKNILSKPVTFRNLIHEYLDANEQHWSKLGIDILLGSPLDKNAATKAAQFLPDYLLKGFDSSSLQQHTLVQNKSTILNIPSKQKSDTRFIPLAIFSMVTLLVVLLSFSAAPIAKKILAVVDFSWLFIFGALGILLLFMWFATNHQTCKYNYNLLWAFPTHFFMAFLMYKKTGAVKKHFQFTMLLSAATIIAWFFLPQQMNIALLPLVILVMVRSYFIQKNNPA